MLGYGDVKQNRDEARKLMQKPGYGPDKPLKLKVSTRNLAIYRDPAVILIDQLKKIYIDGELDVIDSGIWYAKVARKEYPVGLNLTGIGVDDPDQSFYENYACESERNYTQYCNKDLEKLFDQQSPRRTSTSARSWSGRSSASCRTTWRGRSSTTRSGRLLAAAREERHDHAQQHLQRHRFEDVWLDK